MDSPTKVHQDGMEGDFIWEEYLEETKSTAVPHTAFTHVEYSLESGFKVGMQLEVPNPDDKNNYWLASVVMTCGPLLSLRYAGYGDDRSADFWFNVKSGEFHPVGWATANNKKLSPPKGVLEKNENVDTILAEELKNNKSIPASLSENLEAAVMPIDQIKCGMKVEVIDELNPNNIWIATIMQNVGGRLLLRYDGIKSSDKDFWLFYLSDFIQPIKYASIHNLCYSPPEGLKDHHTEEEWKEILDTSLKENENCLPFPAHVLEPRLPLENHAFEQGMKLEAVDPQTHMNLCPATVSQIVNEYYFLVTIDAYEEGKNPPKLCCNSNSQFIFPIKWAQENELELKIPQGYKPQSDKFNWDEYLKFCHAIPAPNDLFPSTCMNMGFESGMKLEAVNSLAKDKIYAATIEKIIEPLMWIHFDIEKPDSGTIITSINSFDLFPVGWCDSNGFPLQTPNFGRVKPNDENNSISVNSNNGFKQSSHKESGKSWCPKIYFNHRCFTGPLLSKSRLAELPKVIGPGPISLVMKDVLTRLINIAYKSSQVLQELRIKGKASPDMQQQIIKAKYKGKSYISTVEFVRHSEQVEEFCRQICLKLECCPYLFGPTYIEKTCPDNCHTQTKTKFGYNFAKKHKKPGRPSVAGTNNTNANEIVKRGPGRKKKRKHWRLLTNSSEDKQNEKKIKLEEESSEVKEEEEEEEEEKKSPQSSPEPNNINKTLSSGRKKWKHMPKYEIVTRGAKLPNFGLWHHVSPFHSRRGRPRTRPVQLSFTKRKVGRPLGSTKRVSSSNSETKSSSFDEEIEEKPAETIISKLKSNPLHWSIEEVVKYLQDTECAPLAPLLEEEEIDGQALLMLNLPYIQEYMRLKLEPATKFCYLIKNLKMEFFTHFA